MDKTSWMPASNNDTATGMGATRVNQVHTGVRRTSEPLPAGDGHLHRCERAKAKRRRRIQPDSKVAEDPQQAGLLAKYDTNPKNGSD